MVMSFSAENTVIIEDLGAYEAICEMALGRESGPYRQD
jgi:hypothetical protein